MSWSRFCSCAKWVEASKCPGNSSTQRVFVHEDDLPASVRRFRFLSTADQIHCWAIDPSGPRVCLPKGAFTYRGPFDYDGCTACEDPEDDTSDGDGGGGGGGGGSGGGGGGSGGGGGGWPGGPGSTPEGIRISVCPGHEQRAADRGWDVDHLYWPASEEFKESFVANVGGICVSVPSGPVVTEPDPAYWVGGGTRYETCSDCTDGHRAELCADDQNLPGAEEAPELWIRKGDRDPDVAGFEWGVWCYQIPAATSPIPEDARLVNPIKDLPCGSCNRGVKYRRCPGEPDPPEAGTEYWAEQGDIDGLLEAVPGLATVWMKIAGVCHSLDLTATPQRIPLDAVRVAPKCGYASCEACQCSGERAPECASRERGIPVRLCTGQKTEGWRETWLVERAIPDGVRWFAHRGFCVFVNPADALSPIPASAEVLRSITNRYDDCAACLAGTGGGGGGDGGGGGGSDPCQEHPPGSPFRPWWCDPIPPMERYFQLRDCETGRLIGQWLRENHLCGRFDVVPCDIAGTVWKVGLLSRCLEVVGPPQPEALGPVVDAKVGAGPFPGCEACAPEDGCYRITGSGPTSGGGGGDCCGSGGCCNYEGSPIDELLTGGPPTWRAHSRGPAGTSDWSLTRYNDSPISVVQQGTSELENCRRV